MKPVRRHVLAARTGSGAGALVSDRLGRTGLVAVVAIGLAAVLGTFVARSRAGVQRAPEGPDAQQVIGPASAADPNDPNAQAVPFDSKDALAPAQVEPAPEPELDARRIEHRAAVDEARAGRALDALARLEALVASYPNDRALREDAVVVAGWAGEDARALELAAELDLAQSPEWVVLAVARSQRDLGRFDDAQATFDGLAAREPASWPAELGAALSAAEAGRMDEALARTARLADAHPDEVDVQFGAALVRRWRGLPFEALAYVRRVLALDAEHADARRLRTALAGDLGGSVQAARLARAQPELWTPSELEAFELEAAARHARWSQIASAAPAERQLDAERALLASGDVLAATQDGGMAHRARVDRLVALSARGAPAEAVHLWQRIERDGEPVPGYARLAVADALASLAARAGDAKLAHDAALQYALARAGLHERGDERHRAGVGGVLTHLSAGECAEARALVRELAAEEPTWRFADGGRQARPNPRRLELDRLATQVEAWCDRPDRAQAELAAFVAAAPGSALLRRDLAGVYRWRGWPRRALAETRRATALAGAPQAGDALAFEALLDLRRWDAAERELERIAARDGEAAAALAALWNERQRFELEARAGYGEGSNQPAFGTRDLAAEGFLFTPPIDDRWRIFAHLYGAWARYEEGDAGLLRTGLGVEYAAGEVIARLELARDLQRELDATGDEDSERDYEALAALTWQPDDRWTLGARWESDTLEDPLRARLHGIDAELFGLDATLRPSELTSADATLAHMRMQDGNERWYGTLGVSRRTVTTPRYRLWLRPEAYASANTLGDQTPYYNPQSDLSLAVTAINEWDGSSHNQRDWLHRIVVSAGYAWQEDFGGSPALAARYEQEVALGERTSIAFGIGWSTATYDDDREERWWIYVDPFRSRFGGWGWR